jgi:hypothetical protein
LELRARGASAVAEVEEQGARGCGEICSGDLGGQKAAALGEARREAQGTVEDIDDADYDWWAGQLKQFAGDNVYKLPTDHDELMALVAPRALLETGNTDFYWLSNRSNLVAARATQQIYNAFGIGDRFGFYIDGGHNHCATLPAEAPIVSSFVSKFMLGNAATNTDVEVFPTAYANLDTSRWTWWWGKQDPDSNPKFPNNWSMGGNFVMDLHGVPGLLGFISACRAR